MEHNTKLLGGIAYIVLIAFSVLGSFVPFAGIITLAAAICVVIAFINAGRELGRPAVKQNMIIALVLYIVGMIIILITVGTAVFAILAGGGISSAALGIGTILGGLIGLVVLIAGAWFWYQASVPMAEATGVGLFKTGGLLIFIGAITTILVIGVVITLIGQILQCVAFFNAPEKQASSV